MSDSPPMFVSGAVARAVFNWREGIAAVQAAYAQPQSASATPPRSIAHNEYAWLRVLPAITPDGRYFGAKLMGMATSAPEPGVEYVIVLFDRETSSIAAFVDANSVTGLRTAATSAAALDRIYPSKPMHLAVLGSGLEASMHVRAFASIRPISTLTVFSPTPARRAAFAEGIGQELAIEARAVTTAPAAIEGADVVLAAARSRGEVPIMYADWLAPHAVVLSIGSTVPEQRELDVSVIERSDLIVCDVPDEVLAHTGDMLAAHTAGLHLDERVISLSDLFDSGQHTRVEAARAPLFKSVGSGLQDIVVAEWILSRALDAGAATPAQMHFEPKR